MPAAGTKPEPGHYDTRAGRHQRVVRAQFVSVPFLVTDNLTYFKKGMHTICPTFVLRGSTTSIWQAKKGRL